MDIINFTVTFLMEIIQNSIMLFLKYVELGVLYPLSYYDGDWYGKNQVNSRFGCIWHGENKELINQYEQQFILEAGL